MDSFPALNSRRQRTIWMAWRAGIVEVLERGDLEATDLVALVGPFASGVIERDLSLGSLPTWAYSPGRFFFMMVRWWAPRRRR